jgi:hypothetical protein
MSEIDFSTIDFTAIEQPSTGQSPDEWDPPRHVYFGKKDPQTGKMAKEPVYKYQPFPAMLYGMTDGKLRAVVVNNEAEKAKYPGFTDTPADFGYIGAPTFEEALAIKAKQEADRAEREAQSLEKAAIAATVIAAEKRGPGRPAKAAA